MPNPLDFLTPEEIAELELSPEELAQAYQPSKGAAIHARGEEGRAKTLLLAHMYRDKVDSGEFTPYDAVGNLTFKGKYGKGFTTLKGSDLFDYLLWFSETLPRHKIVIVSEIDREFPARWYTSKEQTKIALSLWEMQKIDSYFYYDSHVGNSTDLIFHLAAHYNLYPMGVNWHNATVSYIQEDMLHKPMNSDTGLLSRWKAKDIIRTMLIYNRCETTVVGNSVSKKDKKKHPQDLALEGVRSILSDLDIDAEINLPL